MVGAKQRAAGVGGRSRDPYGSSRSRRSGAAAAGARDLGDGLEMKGRKRRVRLGGGMQFDPDGGVAILPAGRVDPILESEVPTPLAEPTIVDLPGAQAAILDLVARVNELTELNRALLQKQAEILSGQKAVGHMEG